MEVDILALKDMKELISYDDLKDLKRKEMFAFSSIASFSSLKMVHNSVIFDMEPLKRYLSCIFLMKQIYRRSPSTIILVALPSPAT